MLTTQAMWVIASGVYAWRHGQFCTRFPYGRVDMRALVIAEQEWLAQTIANGIDWRGFRCNIACTLEEADADLDLILYDAIILQLPVPDGDGLAWLSRRRLHPNFPPVLVLTAINAICERIASLDAGADDCLVNPADSGEIAARLRALLRRPGPRSPPLLHVGGLVFDVAARQLQHHGHEVPLTHKEAELLELLMRRVGTVVRKSVIADALYGYDDDVTPNAVEALVSRLRHKIGAANGASNGEADDAPTLDTVRGMGYMLRDAPSEVVDDRASPLPQDSSDSTSGPSANGVGRPQGQQTTRVPPTRPA